MKTVKMKRDKTWLRNPNQRKNPKIFSAKFIQNPDGSFSILGGETMVLVRENQHNARWENIDTRDFACELRMAGVKSL